MASYLDLLGLQDLGKSEGRQHGLSAHNRHTYRVDGAAQLKSKYIQDRLTDESQKGVYV